MKKKPEILHSELVASSRLFNIESVHLRFSNGVETQYERMRGGARGAVLIAPMLDEHTVLLIREYAVGVERYELALPKGKIEGDESIEDAANREIQEEVGYGAKKLTHLRSMTIAPGYLGHQTHVVLAEDLYANRLPGDEPEEIEVVPWSLNNLPALWDDAECTEARSIATLFLIRDKLHGIG